MPIINNLYGGDPAELVLESIRRKNSIPLQRTHVQARVDSTSSTTGALTLTALEQTADLHQGIYSGEVVIPYQKKNIDSFAPTDVCYGASWPVDFTGWKNYFEWSYGLRIEPGQWRLVRDPISAVIDEDTVLDYDVSVNRLFRMEATADHPLFTEGSGFPVRVTSSELSIDPLRLSLNMPETVSVGETLDINFEVEGGVGPYTFTAIAGQSPVPLNSEQSGMTGQVLNDGTFELTVMAQDLEGRQVEVTESTTSTVSNFRVSGVASTGTIGEPYAYQYSITGGLGPYELLRAEGLPVGGSLSDDGWFTGTMDAGDYEVSMWFRDRLGTVYRHDDAVSILGRPAEELKSLTWTAIDSWVDLDNAAGAMDEVVGTLGGGHWSHVGEGQSVSADEHGAMMVFDGGYIKPSVPTMLYANMGVTVYIKNNRSEPGSCLASFRGPNTGWDLSIGDVHGGQLRARVFIGGHPYLVSTPPEVDLIGNESVAITAQSGDGLLTIHVNDRLVARLSIPNQPVDLTGDEQLYIAGRHDTPEGYRWRGAIRRLTLYAERIWADQLQYLVNGGVGRPFAEVDSYLSNRPWVAPKSTVSVPTIEVGQTCSIEINLGIDPVHVYPALPFDGDLPDFYDFQMAGNLLVMNARWDTAGSRQFRLLVSLTDGAVLVPIAAEVL